MKIKFSEKNIKLLMPSQKAYEAIDTMMPGFILRVQPTGLKTFIFSYKNAAGKRQRKTLGRYGIISLTQAKEMALVTAAEVTKGNDPQAEQKQARLEASIQKNMTLSLFIRDHYEPWVLTHNKRGEYNIEVLNRDFKFLLEKSIFDISIMDVEEWQTKSIKRGLKPNTVNRKLACLKGLFSRAVGLELMDVSPIRKVKSLKQEDDDRTRYLTSDEDVRLKKALRERNAELVEARNSGNAWRLKRGRELYPIFEEGQFADHLEPIVLLAINTGMRRGEIFSLSWTDVCLDEGNEHLIVRAANSKSRKKRYICLNDSAKKVLITWRDQQQKLSYYVFANKSGDKFKDIKKGWQAILEKASIDDFRFHDLRHDFASKLAMKDVPLNTIRELLGHKDIGMTLRYAHLAPDHKMDAVRLLDR